MTGAIPKEVDHEDGDGTNNKWDNIRAVTRLGNAKNHRRRDDNTSGVTGVYWDSQCGTWNAQIGRTRIGRFKTKSLAITARVDAQKKQGYHANHGAVRPL